MSEFFPNVIEEAICEQRDKMIRRSWNMGAETSGRGLARVAPRRRWGGRGVMRRHILSGLRVYSR